MALQLPCRKTILIKLLEYIGFDTSSVKTGYRKVIEAIACRIFASSSAEHGAE